MENPHIHDLSRLKRLVHFPYCLKSVGWMPHHMFIHKNNVIQNCFICICSNMESRGELQVNEQIRVTEPETRPRIGMILPGSVLNSIHATYHDELFFTYSPECTELLLDFFGEEFRQTLHFSFYSFPEECIADIRRELLCLDHPGAADRLDQLAIRLFTELMVRKTEEVDMLSGTRMKIHAAAQEL